MFNLAKRADGTHKYEIEKQLNSSILKRLGDCLLIPRRDFQYDFLGYQSIDLDGGKGSAKGSCVKDTWCSYESESSDTFIFCEGISTSSALFKATKFNVISVFYAENLIGVSQQFRQRYPSAQFYIGADDDFVRGSSKNTGLEAAARAASLSQAHVIRPFSKDGIRRKQDFCDVLKHDGIKWLKKSVRGQM